MPLSPGNPFAALLGGLIPAPATAPSHPAHPARAEPPVDASADPAPTPWPRLPDDFDPFAPPPPAASSPAVSADGGMPAGAFGDLIPGTEPVSIDRLFGLRSADGRDALADFLAAGPLAAPPNAGADVAVPGRRPPPLSTDPLALFGFDGGARTDGVDRAVAHPTAGDHVPELKAAFAPPRLALDGARSGDPRTSASTTGLPSADASAAAAWDAFCEGAGIAVERPQGADAEALRQIGAALRAAVDGTLRLMAVRASSKHELHAPVTVIQPQRNNPLKFSPDVNAALEQLLQPPLRGFMPGPAAVADAMDDLVGHAIGTIAGTRAALEGVLDRFAPRQLESKLAGRSVLDSVLPMNRKARLWELYLQHFETIRSEAQEDFHSLFGRAFLAAYEQQLEHLKRGDAPNG